MLCLALLKKTWNEIVFRIHVAIVVALALVVDEMLQIWIDARTFDGSDILHSMLGVVIGCFLSILMVCKRSAGIDVTEGQRESSVS